MDIFIKKLIGCLIVLLLAIGCLQKTYYAEDKAFLRASEINTIESYEEFIKAYPKSYLTSKARGMLDDLNWERASNANTVEAYTEYISEYSFHFVAAKNKLRKLDEQNWSKVIQSGNVESINNYLSIFPDGEYSNIAITMLDVMSVYNRTTYDKLLIKNGVLLGVDGISVKNLKYNVKFFYGRYYPPVEKQVFNSVEDAYDAARKLGYIIHKAFWNGLIERCDCLFGAINSDNITCQPIVRTALFTINYEEKNGKWPVGSIYRENVCGLRTSSSYHQDNRDKFKNINRILNNQTLHMGGGSLDFIDRLETEDKELWAKWEKAEK